MDMLYDDYLYPLKPLRVRTLKTFVENKRPKLALQKRRRRFLIPNTITTPIKQEVELGDVAAWLACAWQHWQRGTDVAFYLHRRYPLLHGPLGQEAHFLLPSHVRCEAKDRLCSSTLILTFN
jgi:hypothetical protein